MDNTKSRYHKKVTNFDIKNYNISFFKQLLAIEEHLNRIVRISFDVIKGFWFEFNLKMHQS